MLSRRESPWLCCWTQGERSCLPPSAGPTPEAPTVELVAVDFLGDDQAGHGTWGALGFQPDRPVRYSYSYAPSRHGCSLNDEESLGEIIFRAEGDLDGDLVRSIFERRATLEGDGLKPAELLHVHKRTE